MKYFHIPMRKFVPILLIVSFFLVLSPKIHGDDANDPKSLNETIIVWNTNQTLTEDLTITEEHILVIEPGVIISFGEYVTLQINGTITAIGTKDNMIDFRPISSTDCFFIELNPTDNNGRNIFQFCNFIYMGYLNCHGGNLSISDNVFINVSRGISCESECVSYSIQNNSIKSCLDGIYMGAFDGNGTVINNTIHGSGRGFGIVCGSGTGSLIKDNVLINCGIAISMQYSNATVIDNVISNNLWGIGWKGGTPLIADNMITNSEIGLLADSSNASIVNNTICNSTKYGMDICFNSHPIIKDCIITNSGKYDLYIRGNSHPSAINTVFDTEKIFFEDESSSLNVGTEVLSKESTKQDDDEGYSILRIIGTIVVVILPLLILMKILRKKLKIRENEKSKDAKDTKDTKVSTLDQQSDIDPNKCPKCSMPVFKLDKPWERYCPKCNLHFTMSDEYR